MTLYHPERSEGYLQLKQNSMLIIGIAGGSGSGKTTVVKALTEQLKDDVVVIPQDSYYKDLSHATEEEKRVHNFDHPDSIDFELLRHQLKELREGKTVEQPIYSYIKSASTRSDRERMPPRTEASSVPLSAR